MSARCDRHRSWVGQFFRRVGMSCLTRHRGLHPPVAPRHVTAAAAGEMIFDRELRRFRRWPGDGKGSQTTLN